MRQTLRRIESLAKIGCALFCVLLAAKTMAAPRTADDAKEMALGWLAVSQQAPLHKPMPQTIKSVSPVIVKGETVGYVCYLDPQGLPMSGTAMFAPGSVSISIRTRYGWTYRLQKRATLSAGA